ncbi:MAG: DUF1206 domain-containing protein [Solirubrobacteraceae bacterium]
MNSETRAYNSPRRGSAVLGSREPVRELTHSTAYEALARAGLVARGVVFGVIGVLALELAFGAGGKTTSQQGALETIARQPFGRVLLVIVAIGLAGYALWRLVSAAAGARDSADDGASERVPALASGMVYAALCFTAVKILVGAHASGSASSPKHATAGVLGWPGGPVFVTIVGVILIGVAVFQAYQGVARKFCEDVETERMEPGIRRTFTVLGVFGYLARAVVFLLVGYGAIKAALDYNPGNAIGLDGALQKLAHSSFGPELLGIVAVGLVGFAAYCLAEARYRRL